MGSVFLSGPESGCLGTSMSHFLLMVAPGRGPAYRWARQPIPTQATTQAATLEHFSTTYESYISGMVENDFSFIGYKQMPEPPRLQLRSIESVPWNVRFRWTNPK